MFASILVSSFTLCQCIRGVPDGVDLGDDVSQGGPILATDEPNQVDITEIKDVWPLVNHLARMRAHLDLLLRTIYVVESLVNSNEEETANVVASLENLANALNVMITSHAASSSNLAESQQDFEKLKKEMLTAQREKLNVCNAVSKLDKEQVNKLLSVIAALEAGDYSNPSLVKFEGYVEKNRQESMKILENEFKDVQTLMSNQNPLTVIGAYVAYVESLVGHILKIEGINNDGLTGLLNMYRTDLGSLSSNIQADQENQDDVFETTITKVYPKIVDIQNGYTVLLASKVDREPDGDVATKARAMIDTGRVIRDYVATVIRDERRKRNSDKVFKEDMKVKGSLITNFVGLMHAQKEKQQSTQDELNNEEGEEEEGGVDEAATEAEE